MVLKFDLEAKEGVSILQQPLDDSQGLPSYYLFEGCWIELNFIPKKCNLKKDGSNQLWQAFIYFSTSNKTAVEVGTYSNRIQAALKAEQLIKRWKSFGNKVAA